MSRNSWRPVWSEIRIGSKLDEDRAAEVGRFSCDEAHTLERVVAVLQESAQDAHTAGFESMLSAKPWSEEAHDDFFERLATRILEETT